MNYTAQDLKEIEYDFKREYRRFHRGRGHANGKRDMGILLLQKPHNNKEQVSEISKVHTQTIMGSER